MRITHAPVKVLAVRAEADLQGLRAARLAEAYGKFPFCNYYAGDGVTAVIQSGELVLSAAAEVNRAELADFVQFSGASVLSCDRALPLPGWTETSGQIFCGRPKPGDTQNLSEITPRQAEPILLAAFPNLAEMPGWYVNLSHRVRHGVSRVFGYRQQGVAVLLCENSHTALLSMVTVHPDARRQGVGRKMLEAVAALLPEQQLAVYSKNENADRFYTACGLKPTGKWYEYHRQEVL